MEMDQRQKPEVTTNEDLRSLIEKNIDSNKIDKIIYRGMSAISAVFIIFVVANMIDQNGRTSKLESGKLDKSEARNMLRTTSYGTIENTRTTYFVDYVDDIGSHAGVPDSIRQDLKEDVVEKLNNTMVIVTSRGYVSTGQ